MKIYFVLRITPHQFIKDAELIENIKFPEITTFESESALKSIGNYQDHHSDFLEVDGSAKSVFLLNGTIPSKDVMSDCSFLLPTSTVLGVCFLSKGVFVRLP